MSRKSPPRCGISWKNRPAAGKDEAAMNLVLIALLICSLAISGSLVADGALEGGPRIRIVMDEE